MEQETLLFMAVFCSFLFLLDTPMFWALYRTPPRQSGSVPTVPTGEYSVKPGLRIRIHFWQIRIQHLFLMRIRFQLKQICIYFGFKIYSPLRPRVFNTLFIQYYSEICRPSDHTVGRPPPRAEIRTRAGRSRGRDNNHLPPPTRFLKNSIPSLFQWNALLTMQ